MNRDKLIYFKFQLFKETFDCLVSFFCDINAKDSKGFTPLHYASMQDNYGAALLLLDQSEIKKDVRITLLKS